MNHLIGISGITTLGTVSAIATVAAAAINPIGAALLLVQGGGNKPTIFVRD
ncbi:hypothetical protein [Tolypothrix sp. VBCCA 56010]|uniref:hypothetical protein n=1 Tax=Tolypothrix sp. VBCCA 56010 TaxID=3137731 RepID=UPI003D7C8354